MELDLQVEQAVQDQLEVQVEPEALEALVELVEQEVHFKFDNII